MILEKNTIIYFSEIGHNNMIYPNKDKSFRLEEQLVCETFCFFNSERFVAIKFNIEKYPSLYWVEK